MRQIGRMALLLLVALFQTALAPTLWSLRIDWVLVVVVCWTLLRGLGGGIRWALYGGIALDILSPLPIGTHLLGLTLAAATVATVTDGLGRDSRMLHTASVLLVSLLYALCLALVMGVTGRPVAWSRYPVTVMLPAALANTAATLPVYFFLNRFARSSRPQMEFDG